MNVRFDTRIKIHPWPHAADVAFAIRDDDFSYFTPSDKIERIYKNAWNMGFKVSFATIPKHKGVNKLNVPPKFRGTNEYYPIYENTELVKYFKTKLSEGKVDIMQHGFCHAERSILSTPKFDFDKGIIADSDNQKMNLVQSSEFYGLKEGEAYSKVSEGKSILERSFGVPVKVFVAPQELLTKSLWMALFKNNLNYCGGVGRNIITRVPINHINFHPLFKAATKKALRVNQESIAEDIMHITDIITIPATYRHYWNKFRNDELSEYMFNHFKTIFENKKERNGYFILLTHYWEYFYDWEDAITQRRQHEYLNKILKYVDDNSNVWKCTISELVEWIMARKKLVVKERNGRFEIFSACEMNGLSITADGINTKKIPEENIIFHDGNIIVLNLNKGEKISLFKGGSS